jgi:iron complex outermembrane receptor protein
MGKLNSRTYIAFTGVLLTLGLSPVFAQSSDSKSLSVPSEEKASKSTKSLLEEIIVTAQRRKESAQEVAISITVFNQEQIANANMTNSSDIATYTPSLTVDTRFGNENTSFAIRGFTQSLRTTASVATYFAEVVAPRGQTSQTSGDGAGPGTLFDLQNLQVLKGPQGTLFGRNTTGGAILLVPRKPTDEFEGYLELSKGNFDAERGQLVLNAPLNENFKLRLGVDKNRRSGHLNNVTKVGANELGNTNYTALRLGIDWNITENIENYTILTAVDSESAGYTAQLFACNESANPNENTFFAFTGLPCQNQLNNAGADGQKDYYDITSTVKTPITTIKEERFINTTTWQINDSLTLKNIFAYAHLETRNGSDIFGTNFTEPQSAVLGAALPLGLADPKREFTIGVSTNNPDFPVTSQETYVDEIQLQGSSFDDRLFWQTGLYYENSQPDGFSGNNSASFLYCDLNTIETSDPSQYNCFDPSGGLLGSVLVQQYKTEFLNKAVYAQGTFDWTKSFSTTLGLRYTKDEAKGYGIKTRYTYALNIPQAPIVSISAPEIETEAPTGLLEFNYRPIDDIMIYAKYTRGYRQGSVNLAADPGLDIHTDETVDSYEIGAKTTFGGPVPGRFNIAVFDNDLKDMQLQNGYISSTAGPTTAITNAGNSSIKGFEVDAYFQLSDSIDLSLAYSMLDTELLSRGTVDRQGIADAVTAASGNPASGQLAAATFVPIADVGDELPFAPEESLVASLNYTIPSPASLGVMNLGVTYVYTGEQRAAATSASPFAIIPAFELINLNASWMDIFRSNIDLALYATNVTEEEYVTYVAGTYNTLGIESRQVGLPRMFGARLRYSF